MIMLGKKITAPGDKLTKIPLKQLVDKIKKPNQQMIFLFESLLHLNLLNPKLYREKKVQLPYVVPSIFSPPIRKTQNFIHSEHIILDIDHLSTQNLDPNKIKKIIAKDPTVELAFISPSGTGLKVFFRIDTKITHPKIYSEFYKKFAQNFANAYNLTQYIDIKTNDVTRACFLSYDKEIYYNPNPEKIQTEKIINDIKLFVIEKQTDKQQNTEIKTEKLQQQTDNEKLPKDVFYKIKQKLNPQYKPREQRKKQIFVPEELKLIEKKIIEHLKDKYPEIQIHSIKDIHYGKQFLFKYDIHYAELNVFFGKKGIKVIKTLKKINNKEFQDIIYKIFIQIIENVKIQKNS